MVDQTYSITVISVSVHCYYDYIYNNFILILKIFSHTAQISIIRRSELPYPRIQCLPPGIVKQRFSDFVVNELDMTGDVVHLTSVSLDDIDLVDNSAEKEAVSDPSLVPEELIDKQTVVCTCIEFLCMYWHFVCLSLTCVWLVINFI